MNQNWNCSLWEICLRTMWLFIAAYALLRLMAWADTGARDLESNEVLPSERAHDINYGNERD